ncbi:hypothetical protein BDZ91DRAFT_727682 [Kalaharituber pfeilii]|nr:hypothetical protein BDZ91DRAFT_727682 [Kalaharituber pfeilii]
MSPHLSKPSGRFFWFLHRKARCSFITLVPSTGELWLQNENYGKIWLSTTDRRTASLSLSGPAGIII